MLANRAGQCKTATMRFFAGLRLVLVAAALIGLLAGRPFVVPVATAHEAMTMTMTTVKAGHYCCGKASQSSTDRTNLPGDCVDPGCSPVAPALLPGAPTIVSFVEGSADRPTATAALAGRSLPPLLEPPRA